MTSFEHIMLGVNGTLAAGLHHKHQWKIVAMAGVAAALPDWDGVTWLVSNEAFGEGHRVWGHNILACLMVGMIAGIVDYRWDVVTRFGRVATRMLRLAVPEDSLVPREQFSGSAQRLWILVAVIAALSQLPADLVVSGTATLPVWGLKLLWPFSDREWSFQMVTYNDPGVIIVFIVGMFAMAKWPKHLAGIARLTLAFAVAYLLLRGFVWHERPFGS